jgi:NADH:ubiquinone oxidoreductase subunit C
MIKVYNNFLDSLISEIPKLNIKGSISMGEMTLIVPSKNLYPLMIYLRNRTNCRYTLLCDITATDFLEREIRFEVVYNLLSNRYHSRIRIKTSVNELTEVESITSLFPNAN